MKKLLVVFMVVSMLAIAGGAFAEEGHTGHEENAPITIDKEAAKKAAEGATNKAQQAATEAEKTAVMGNDAVKTLFADFKAEDVITDMTNYLVKDATPKTLETIDEDEKAVLNALPGVTKFFAAYVAPVKLPNGKPFMIRMSIDTTNLSKATKIKNEFNVFPGGLKAGLAAGGWAIVSDKGVSLTPEAMKTAAEAFFVGVVDGSNTKKLKGAADDDVTLEPAIVVADDNGATPSKNRLSGDGAGCAMGTSAMALLVLGAFVTMRKK